MKRRLIPWALALLLCAGCAGPAQPTQSPTAAPQPSQGEDITFTRDNFPRLDGSTSTAPLGRAIAAACNLLNPSKVIIGGGISLAFDLFEASLWDTLRQYIYWNANQQLTIQPTALGYNGGLLGAAAVAVCGLENRHGWGMVESRKPGQ